VGAPLGFQQTMAKKSRKKPSRGKAKAKPVPEKEESLPVPQHGWVAEYDKSKKALKSETNAEAYLRVARAAFVLRRWDKVVKYCTKALEECDAIDDVHRNSLKKLNDEATVEQRNCQLTDADKDFFRPLVELGHNVDLTPCSIVNETFSNLNLLHLSVTLAKPDWFDRAVAMGAAIDFPVLKVKGNCPAPPQTTALLFAALTLATYCMVPPNAIPNQASVLANTEEICKLLLLYGADTSLRLQQPEGQSVANFMYIQMGLVGKSARELILKAKKPRIIEVLKMTEKDPDYRNCRCGSRQLWYNCHGNKSLIKHFPFFVESSEGSRHWRYSPMARCPCKNTEKLYIDCCWHETTRLAYQDDKTGKLSMSQFTSGHGVQEMAKLMQTLNENGMNFEDMFAGKNEVDDDGVALLTKQGAEYMRTPAGRAQWQTLDRHPKSAFPSYDMDVYSGVYEEIDRMVGPGKCFMWTNLHWKLDESELLVRTKEWNAALQSFCSKQTSWTEEHRREMIRIHTASPLAPCGCPSCDETERQVKEYKKCSRCRQIAYCSVNCQRNHWKEHKKDCLGAK